MSDPLDLTPKLRELSIAAARRAVEAHAAAERASQPSGPGVHVLPLFKSALATMEAAHNLANASDPGGEETTGRSALAERLYAEYAERTGVPTREGR